MKYLPLIWKSLWRRKVRTTFTLLSIFIAFLLFGILMTIRAAFSIGVDLAGMDRLILIHKISLIMPLPQSYEGRLETVPGVDIVSNSSWFGGIYQDPKNFFAQMAVEPEKYLAIYKEFKLPADQKKAWFEDRKGAIVGRALADRFGWKVGDHIPIQATIWQPKGGGLTWDFNLVGIYDGDPGVQTDNFFFHYDYLNENRQNGEGLVGWYIVKVKDPKQSTAMAKAFDDRVGCAVMLEVLKRLQNVPHPNTVYAAGTVQEELGMRGAQVAVQAVQPDVGIAFEPGAAGDYPSAKPEESQEILGRGASMNVLDSSYLPGNRILAMVKQTAKAKGIPLQSNLLMGYGQDAMEIQRWSRGVPAILLTVPTRYLYSHNGIIHRDDFDAVVTLTVELVRTLDAATVTRLAYLE
jgi:hypothetical protein